MYIKNGPRHTYTRTNLKGDALATGTDNFLIRQINLKLSTRLSISHQRAHLCADSGFTHCIYIY